MKQICIFFITIFLTGELKSQLTYEWSQSYNSPANNLDAGVGIAVDSQKNVYVTGYSVGISSSYDFATVKYNSAGAEQWVGRFNGAANGDDFANDIAVDQQGNVFVTGYSGPGVDYATVKYNPNGEELWRAIYDGTGADNPRSIAVDANGNAYVTGQSYSGVAASYDIVTIKYTADGIQQWIRRFNGSGSGNDIAYAIITDNQNNVYLTGQSFSGAGRDMDIITIKYDDAGNELWTAKFNGSGNDIDVGYSIDIDESGNVAVTGYSRGAGTGYDYAVLKYDTQGNEIWVRVLDGPLSKNDIPSAVKCDKSGNVYVTGVVNNDVLGNYANYGTVKYNTGGDLIWLAFYNGSFNGNDSATAMEVTDSGYVVVTGKSFLNGNFDFATIAYTPAGSTRSIALFDGTGNGTDIPFSMAVDDFGHTYIAGMSFGINSGFDFLTLKYSFIQGVGSSNDKIPDSYHVSSNFPNPFNPVTNINYAIKSLSEVKLKVFNSLGVEVASLVNGIQQRGNFTVKWDASDFPSGVYFYKFEAFEISGKGGEVFSRSGKMILAR